MDKVDKSLVSAFSKLALDRDKKVNVLVASHAGESQQLADDLGKQGIKVLQLINELDILVAEINHTHLNLLQDSERVSYVELDKDVNTQAD